MPSYIKGGQVWGCQVNRLCPRGNDVCLIDLILDYLELMKPSANESMKSSAVITDTLFDPTTSHSEEPSDASCLRLFQEGLLRLPLRPQELASDRQVSSIHGHSGFRCEFDCCRWRVSREALSEGTNAVNVRARVGSACLEIVKSPHLNFTISDPPSATDQDIAVSFPTLIVVFERT